MGWYIISVNAILSYLVNLEYFQEKPSGIIRFVFNRKSTANNFFGKYYISFALVIIYLYLLNYITTHFIIKTIKLGL